MAAFVAGEIDGVTFEQRFLAAFRTQPGDEPMPYAADLAFYAVDAFCSDPALRDANDLDEEQLREEVASYLARLEEPWPHEGGKDEHNRQFARWMDALRETVRGLGPKGK